MSQAKLHNFSYQKYTQKVWTVLKIVQINLKVGLFSKCKILCVLYFQNIFNLLSWWKVVGTKLAISKSGWDMSPMACLCYHLWLVVVVFFWVLSKCLLDWQAYYWFSMRQNTMLFNTRYVFFLQSSAKVNLCVRSDSKSAEKSWLLNLELTATPNCVPAGRPTDVISLCEEHCSLTTATEVRGFPRTLLKISYGVFVDSCLISLWHVIWSSFLAGIYSWWIFSNTNSWPYYAFWAFPYL